MRSEACANAEMPKITEGAGADGASAHEGETSEPEPGAQDQHRVKIELRVERTLYVLGPPKTVLLAVEQKIADWNVAFLQRCDHEFGLVRRDDAILRSLEENYRCQRRSTWLIGERST